MREAAMHDLLSSGAHPSRNPAQNLADLRAQIAANAKGSSELKASGRAIWRGHGARLHAARAG